MARDNTIHVSATVDSRQPGRWFAAVGLGQGGSVVQRTGEASSPAMAVKRAIDDAIHAIRAERRERRAAARESR